MISQKVQSKPYFCKSLSSFNNVSIKTWLGSALIWNIVSLPEKHYKKQILEWYHQRY